ncbi:MAG TPA: SCO family protein [Acidimicrobiales bacterium]|nr:SCO family protein [Acidimicrobiales bacterium]
MAVVADPAAPLAASGDRVAHPHRWRRAVSVLVAGCVVVAGLLTWRSLQGSAPGAPPASMGNAVDLALPATVLDAPLVDQQGRPRPLSSFRGHILVLVPFLTSCQEECPITTGAFLVLARDVRAAGLQGKVEFAEASVDPARDVPSRLSAYEARTGAHWPILTGTPSTMAALWKHFGVYVQQVPEANPPGDDWQTGAPYTYDVDHSDGFILIGPDQHERFVTVAPVDLRGHALDRPLASMLDSTGVTNLSAPTSGSWTIAQALQAIGWLAGRTIPQAR